MKRLLLLPWLLWVATTSAQAYTIAEIARADRLLGLIDRRLQIGELVARAKWNSHAPLEDRERERQVLESFARQAAAAKVASSEGKEQGQRVRERLSQTALLRR